MLGTRVDVELARHLLAELVLREHAADRATNDFLGAASEERLERLRPQASGVARVPHAGALGPAIARSFAATIPSNVRASILPRPTQRSVPTIARTIPRRNASAVISKRSRPVSGSHHSARRTERTPPGPAANDEKS